MSPRVNILAFAMVVDRLVMHGRSGCGRFPCDEANRLKRACDTLAPRLPHDVASYIYKDAMRRIFG